MLSDLGCIDAEDPNGIGATTVGQLDDQRVAVDHLDDAHARVRGAVPFTEPPSAHDAATNRTGTRQRRYRNMEERRDPGRV
jgi:hypothetical protein